MARRPNDFYETPEWATHRILEALWASETHRKLIFQKLIFMSKESPSSPRWLEPSAGTGAIARAVKSWEGMGDLGIRWSAVEKDPSLADRLAQSPAGRHFEICDFLSADSHRIGGNFDLVIGNPPYKQAEEFVIRAASFAPYGLFLLRCGFLESTRRARMFDGWAPDVFVLPERPCFTGDGKTDMSSYAWCLFHYREERRRGTIQWCKTTPRYVRHGFTSEEEYKENKANTLRLNGERRTRRVRPVPAQDQP